MQTTYADNDRTLDMPLGSAETSSTHSTPSDQPHPPCPMPCHKTIFEQERSEKDDICMYIQHQHEHDTFQSYVPQY